MINAKVKTSSGYTSFEAKVRNVYTNGISTMRVTAKNSSDARDKIMASKPQYRTLAVYPAGYSD